MVQYAHNTPRNATTGHSPYELLFHQHPNRPEKFAVPQPAGLRPPRTVERMDSVFRQVKVRIRSAQEERRKRVGGKANCGYDVGQQVRIKLQPAQRKLGKLHAHKSELYTVVERKNNTYLLEPCGSSSRHHCLQRHYNELEAAPSQRLSWE